MEITDIPENLQTAISIDDPIIGLPNYMSVVPNYMSVINYKNL